MGKGTDVERNRFTTLYFSQALPDSAASLAEVEIGAESVAALVTTGHELPIGAEEEANQ